MELDIVCYTITPPPALALQNGLVITPLPRGPPFFSLSFFLFSSFFLLFFFLLVWLSGYSAGLVIERSRVPVPTGAVREFSTPGLTFCADSYFDIRSSSVTAVARERSRSFCQKCRLQLNIRAPYIFGF